MQIAQKIVFSVTKKQLMVQRPRLLYFLSIVSFQLGLGEQLACSGLKHNLAAGDLLVFGVTCLTWCHLRTLHRRHLKKPKSQAKRRRPKALM